MSAIDYDSAAAYWGESVPGDASAGLAAYAAGTIGVLSAAALGAMFAVEVPRGGPYVFGRLNDFSGGVFFATTIPVIIQLHRRLPATRASRTGLAVVVGASGAAAASGVLLALQVMPFGASTAVSITGIVSQAAWAAASQHSLLHSGRLPARLARSGRAIGALMLGALPLVGIGVLPSTAPWLRTLLHSVGGGIVGAAYVAWPVWLFAAGRQLRRPARSGRA